MAESNEPKTRDAATAALARLAEVERERDAERAKNAELSAKLEASKTQIGLRPEAALTLGDNPYKFHVFVRGEGSDQIPTMDVECSDESEAKRWFILNRKDPTDPTKLIDLLKYHVDVKCTDPRRANDLRATRRLALIKEKAARSQQLTDEEKTILDEYELKMMEKDLVG